ncbi:PKD domain-containing protein [Candidatus Bipolaricaulota bacterium]|nr:PKD domain-containing protein [Candidatus Bipolaricaulota bacterium]
MPNRRDHAKRAVHARFPFRFAPVLLAAAALLLLLLNGCTLFQNQPPVAGASVSPTSGRAPLVVAFDGSPSYDPDGIIVAYTWTFADGRIVTEESPEHTFVSAGQYTIAFTVTDDHGAISATALTVSVDPPNAPPVPRIAFSPDPAQANQDIVFSAATSTDDGQILQYLWSFGDGSTASGEISTHRYEQPGTYTVTLSVTDNDGAGAVTTATVSVRENADEQITGPTIIARMSVSESLASPGETITFDGQDSTSSEDGLSHFVWSFGDGATAVGAVTTHRYMTAGEFTVRLVVADVSGASAFCEQVISVTDNDAGEDPTPPIDGIMTCSYTWWYNSTRRTVSLEIPSSLYQEYASRTRCVSVYGTYDQYILDRLDDSLMIELAGAVSAAAAGGDYYDIAENALYFVQTIVAYAPDPSGIEYPRYPVESLVERIGDCEDSSILYASLLRTLGHGAVIAGVDTGGSGIANHMVVFVPVDEDFTSRFAEQDRDSLGLWVIDGRLYALAETAVDGSTLRLGVDPWGLDGGDIHQIWDVARILIQPQVARYEVPESS